MSNSKYILNTTGEYLIRLLEYASSTLRVPHFCTKYFCYNISRLIGYYPTYIMNSAFRCDAYHYSFWRNVRFDRWEKDTFNVLEHVLNTDMIYCDIGAWIGPTVLYSATKCKMVYCFEPDPHAFSYLALNIVLNKLSNTIPFNMALHSHDGFIEMSSFGRNTGDSMTSTINPYPSVSIKASCLKWDTLNRTFNIPIVDMFKVDIEGGEFELIHDISSYLNRYKPILYISLHAPFLNGDKRAAASGRLIEILLDTYKYRYDSYINPVNPDRFSKEDILLEFPSFLFSDVKLDTKAERAARVNPL